MSAPLRLGLVGCGRVAWERHLPALARTTGLRVRALADVDPARLHRLADQNGVTARYTDYRALLDDREIDVVGVLTPTSSHVDIACAALESGRHVLVEKPMGLNPAECARLSAVAAGSPGQATVAFNLRHHRLVQQARSIVASGCLGRIKAIRSAYTHDRTGVDAPDWHRVISLGGGVVANEAVHHFDLWRFLLGADIQDVACSSRPSAAYEDETSTVSATLSDGVQASGLFTLGSSPTSEVDVYGDAGRLHLDCYRFDGLAFYTHGTYPGDLRDRARKAVGALRLLAGGLPAMRRGGDFQDGFRVMWQHFADAIQQGGTPLASLDDGAKAVAASSACLRSAAEGSCRVTVSAAIAS